MQSMRECEITALLVGQPVPVARANSEVILSGIAKRIHNGALWLSCTGLEGDRQGDQHYHGGPDKALHHYAADHYAVWSRWFPDSIVPMAAGAFGENVSTSGLTEHDVHVGDVFRAGPTLLQVTQARQPCFKLNLRVGSRDAAQTMQASGRTGWYYRVLREGWLEAGDRLELIDRPLPDWPLTRIIAALFPDDPSAPGLHDEWRQAAGLTELAQRWRGAFERRLRTGAIEDWSMRLHGPAGMHR